jgi:hypothetical protein
LNDAPVVACASMASTDNNYIELKIEYPDSIFFVYLEQNFNFRTRPSVKLEMFYLRGTKFQNIEKRNFLHLKSFGLKFSELLSFLVMERKVEAGNCFVVGAILRYFE